MSIVRSIRLLFAEAGSDKEYRVQIEDNGTGTYDVDAFYGRRGSNLKAAPQGRALDLAAAEKLFQKTVNSKTAKGYRIDEATSDASIAGIREPDDTGLRAQLLNPISETELDAYLNDDAWIMEEKHDGERLLARKTNDNTIVFANRKGQRTTVPREIEDALGLIPQSFVIDGENVNGIYFVFDALEYDGLDLRSTPYDQRISYREALLERDFNNLVRSVRGHVHHKRIALNELRTNGKEGVVFKRRQAEWSAGRPASGGDHVKFKFWTSLSAIAAAHHPSKNSIALELIDDSGNRVPVGNVTVKPNQEMPSPGAVVEIKYLYVIAKGGSLYQPELIAVRHDIDVAECTTAQIKYKGI